MIVFSYKDHLEPIDKFERGPLEILLDQNEKESRSIRFVLRRGLSSTSNRCPMARQGYHSFSCPYPFEVTTEEALSYTRHIPAMDFELPYTYSSGNIAIEKKAWWPTVKMSNPVSPLVRMVHEHCSDPISISILSSLKLPFWGKR